MYKIIYAILVIVFCYSPLNAQITLNSQPAKLTLGNIDPNDFLDLDYLEKNGYTKAPGSDESEFIYAKSAETPFNGIVGFQLLQDEKKESFLTYFNDPKNNVEFKKTPTCEQLEGINSYYKIKEVGEGDQKIFEIEASFFIGSEILAFFTMNEKTEGALASLSEACQIIKLK